MSLSRYRFALRIVGLTFITAAICHSAMPQSLFAQSKLRQATIQGQATMQVTAKVAPSLRAPAGGWTTLSKLTHGNPWVGPITTFFDYEFGLTTNPKRAFILGCAGAGAPASRSVSETRRAGCRVQMVLELDHRRGRLTVFAPGT